MRKIKLHISAFKILWRDDKKEIIKLMIAYGIVVAILSLPGAILQNPITYFLK